MNTLGNKISLLLVFLSFVLISCDDDGYSLGKRWETFATVYPSSEFSYYFVFDNGEKIAVASSEVAYKPKANQRVFLNFTYLSDSADGFDHYIKVNWLTEILTKNIVDLTPENQEYIGNDPVKIHSLWIGDDYLNIYFGYNYGRKYIHHINLVNNTMDEPADDGKIYLEFRHNKNNDPEWYGKDEYAAFNLRTIRSQAEIMGKDSVDLVVGVQDFKDEYKTYKITYKFNNAPDVGIDNG